MGSRILVCLFTSVAPALDLMGVPNAGCGTGSFRRGVRHMVRVEWLCYRWPSFLERVVLV